MSDHGIERMVYKGVLLQGVLLHFPLVCARAPRSRRAMRAVAASGAVRKVAAARWLCYILHEPLCAPFCASRSGVRRRDF